MHVDAYRLGSLDEVDDLDLDASLPESVTVVEWGEGRVEGLAEDRLVVELARTEGDRRRRDRAAHPDDHARSASAGRARQRCPRQPSEWTPEPSATP